MMTANNAGIAIVRMRLTRTSGVRDSVLACAVTSARNVPLFTCSSVLTLRFVFAPPSTLIAIARR